MEPTFAFLAANVENVHQPVVSARNRFEFLQTLKLAVEILRAIETVAPNDLHGAQGADDAACQPNLAITTGSDGAQQFEVGDVRSWRSESIPSSVRMVLCAGTHKMTLSSPALGTSRN